MQTARGWHPRGATLAVLITVLALSGCGGTSGSPAAVRRPPTRQPGETVAATPKVVVPLSERQTSRTHIPKADALAELAGFVWVKSDNGSVYKVDPANGKVVGIQHVDTAKNHDPYCQGIGTEGAWIWACAAAPDSTAVVRMDPATMRVVERYEVDKPFDQLKLPTSMGRIWAFSGDGSRLVGLKAGEDSLEFSLPIRCNNLTPAGRALILTCPVTGEVLRLDPRSGKVTARVELRQPQLAAGTAEDVWVAAAPGVTRLDATTLQTKVVYPDLVPGLEGDVFLAGDGVWIRLGGSRFLYVIDPATNEVTLQIRTPDAFSGTTGGSLMVTDDHIWATFYEIHLLVGMSR